MKNVVREPHEVRKPPLSRTMCYFKTQIDFLQFLSTQLTKYITLIHLVLNLFNTFAFTAKFM
jgi:hypothetical protein